MCNRPYADAFGLETDNKTHQQHVMDVNKVLDELRATIVPPASYLDFA